MRSSVRNFVRYDVNLRSSMIEIFLEVDAKIRFFFYKTKDKSTYSDFLTPFLPTYSDFQTVFPPTYSDFSTPLSPTYSDFQALFSPTYSDFYVEKTSFVLTNRKHIIMYELPLALTDSYKVSLPKSIKCFHTSSQQRKNHLTQAKVKQKIKVPHL